MNASRSSCGAAIAADRAKIIRGYVLRKKSSPMQAFVGINQILTIIVNNSEEPIDPWGRNGEGGWTVSCAEKEVAGISERRARSAQNATHRRSGLA